MSFVFCDVSRRSKGLSQERLLSLWMAEGFVRKVDMKRLSDVAGDYLTDLIRRSLLMVAKQTSMGRVKRCRIHDLLYEFCSQKAKEEHFFHFLGGGGYNELSAFNEPWFFACKLLRVLDLEQIHLDDGIPSEIGQLLRLVYLTIGGYVWEIPASIGNLSRLETLIIYVDEGFNLPLPDSFWNLQRIKHFFLSSKAFTCDMGFRLPVTNLGNSSDLYGLDSIFGVAIPHDALERVLEKFPNTITFVGSIGEREYYYKGETPSVHAFVTRPPELQADFRKCLWPPKYKPA
ncbi:OLC1v1013478C1 [Oldenlandia corymbosa var. corymbosa]|uniref:OLC1v1013478C1 n=1 Tax=Oldenlandia corymbosa var. corymbosa TaxID=529605 RepID=A0AAV1E202_OLDCO|nr:OLC1v1013478C1 [Oldenlandia corymbosa var. corymbosa]